MQNEELDEQTAEKVNEIIDEVMRNVARLCSIKNQYTDMNLIMNVLTGCMVKMMGCLHAELRPIFIEIVAQNLEVNRQNFENRGV